MSVYDVIINYFRIKKDKMIKQVYDPGLLEFLPHVCIYHLWQDKTYHGWVVFTCDIALLRTSTYPSHSDTCCLIAHYMQVDSLLLRRPQWFSIHQHNLSQLPWKAQHSKSTGRTSWKLTKTNFRQVWLVIIVSFPPVQGIHVKWLLSAPTPANHPCH